MIQVEIPGHEPRPFARGLPVSWNIVLLGRLVHHEDMPITAQEGAQQLPSALRDRLSPLAAVAGEESRPTEAPDGQGAITRPNVRALPPGQNLVHLLARKHIQEAERPPHLVRWDQRMDAIPAINCNPTAYSRPQISSGTPPK
jgi:hypothetical protein